MWSPIKTCKNSHALKIKKIKKNINNFDNTAVIDNFSQT